MANKTKITASPGGREVIIEREFEAPIEKVWRAWTEPDLFIKWIGPRGLKGKIDAWDLTPGGKYSYTHTDPKTGEDYTFIGFNHLIDTPKQLVSTFEWLGMPGHISLNTAAFEDLGNGRTKVTSSAVFQTSEDRDGMIQGGMEQGVVEGNERLDELLEKL